MPQHVTSGAQMACSFGAAPSALTVIPAAMVNSGGPAGANIMDHKPAANVAPFGMCSSLSNPTVSAATAAAQGVLTPQPCVPATASPWSPGVTTVKLGNQPALDNTCTLKCNWAGVITITNPGQTTVMTGAGGGGGGAAAAAAISAAEAGKVGAGEGEEPDDDSVRSAVIAGAVIGAIVGAVIGAALGPVGVVVGAALGAVVGAAIGGIIGSLFGRKKKKDQGG